MTLFARRGKSARRDDVPLSEQLIVVVDVETSGLDPYADRLIAIGAVALHGRLITFNDSLYVVVQQTQASSVENIVVHGIDGTTQLAGRDPRDALSSWLRFAGDAPIVGFHADFDRVVIARATQAVLGVKPTNTWLDLAFLVRALFGGTSYSGAREGSPHGSNTLDNWMARFGLEAYARHDALADALATAQLLQIVLAEAARRGIRSLSDLRALEREQRWLVRSLRSTGANE